MERIADELDRPITLGFRLPKRGQSQQDAILDG
jgi:hypothetical protein